MLAKLLKWLGFAKKSRITVVIPALNEEKTIGSVIRLAKRTKGVDEVIVVDDNSADGTLDEAFRNGAEAFKSAVLGKGFSMREGLERAKNEVVVFLDGDIESYDRDVVERLAEPLLNDQCDFVKGSFSREAGRVTELVAKPLLSILFPELTRYSQPLGGMIAARKDFLLKLKFENDYGVDIGILIDMHNRGARIREVDIGPIANKSKPWQALGRMSREVSKAILKRAEIRKILSLDELGTINVIRDEMEDSINASMLHLSKMILFDMDDTILLERFIHRAAESLGFQDRLNNILSMNHEPYIITMQIAGLLRDVSLDELLRITDGIGIVAGLDEVIGTLKSRGYLVGIVSDSYDVVANFVKKKVGADFALANELEVMGGKATGEVRVPSFFIRGEKSRCNHGVCKSNALMHLSEKHGVSLADMIAVGDSEADICMVKMAGIGVAFCSDNKLLNAVADKIISEKTFKALLSFAE